MIARSFKKAIKHRAKHLLPYISWTKDSLSRLEDRLRPRSSQYLSFTNPQEIRTRTLQYLSSMKVNGSNLYRHSQSVNKPVLYATVSALLTKKLFNEAPTTLDQESVNAVATHQCEDGLFRDPIIACPLADTEDWWGWRHLTLHALMTLALYNKPAKHELRYVEQFYDKDKFKRFLENLDWGDRVAWTSNTIQNIGVMLQYAREYQGSNKAREALEVLFEVIDSHQDPTTGLFGHRFDSPEELSNGVQAGYHFWLLYFYDKRPIPYMERIIDNVLKTQNILGGYGVKWNSSACEDIDSIDPLVRFSKLTEYRRDDIQASLRRALPAILMNLNGDGGWVFRRHEELTIVHSQMHSKANESNLFYTWFRTLGLAYCLTGLDKVPPGFSYPWHFSRAPGHQFL